VNLGAAYLAKVRQSAPLELEETLPWLPDPGIVVRGAYDQIDLERARRQFELALEADPTHTKALAGLALVELRLGQPELARDYLEHALTLEPGAPELLLCLGNVLVHVGQYEEAMT
jgi:Tfp pilus assembly protein PilF